MRAISAATPVAAVVGAPVRHSLSPLIHNAWIAASEIDAVYVAFEPTVGRFEDFARGLRGGVIRGLNVTAPFKEQALALADRVSRRACEAGSANLLLFDANGDIRADNTDGEGLLYAFITQVPRFDPAAGPVVIMGAGGAARGAAAAFLEAGAPAVCFVNRTVGRAAALAGHFGDRAGAAGLSDLRSVLSGAHVLINATPLGFNGEAMPVIDLAAAPPTCVVMDMVYRPVVTSLLDAAAKLGLRTVDGLQMLIGQARPSFKAFFGRPPPAMDIRALAVTALEPKR
jgi:shikimate dehydrogenase